MYFLKFPKIAYTLDDGLTYQGIQDILRRVTLSFTSKTKAVAYELYDIEDGETPEVVAHKFYKNTNRHWIILHANEILDPRFDWPLSQYDLKEMVKQKYGEANVYAIHHYERVLNEGTESEMILTSPVRITGQEIGRVDGGFGDDERDYVWYQDPSQATYNNYQMFYPTTISNFEYEDRINESKRRIKIIVPALVPEIEKEFTKIIER